MKKIISVLLILVIFVSGCSSEESSTGDDTIRIRAGYTDNFSQDTAQLNYMRDYTGYDVEWVTGPLENSLDKFMLELGSQEPYNIAKVSYSEIGTILQQGLAADLSPYMDSFTNSDTAIPDVAWDMCTDSETGAIYCIPSLQGNDNIINTVIARTDILDEYGIEEPTTTDELLDATCKLADEGVSRPWAINWNTAFWDYGVKQAYGIGWDFNYEDYVSGDLVYVGNDERFYEFLDWAKEMYDCGGYGVDYETITQEDRNASFINGDSVFMTAPWWEAEAQSQGMETQGINYEDAVSVLDLTGPNGNKMYEQEGNSAWNYTFVPVYMEDDIEKSIDFINKTWDDEYILQTQFGVEGESFDYNDDGVPVRKTSSDVIYPEEYGTCAGDNCGPEYYLMATPVTALEESTAAKNQGIIDAVEAGDGTANDIATVRNNEFKDFGNLDPTAPMVVAPIWNDSENCATTATTTFTDLYIVGQKTEDDIPAFQEELATCGVEDATQEVNDWAKTFY